MTRIRSVVANMRIGRRLSAAFAAVAVVLCVVAGVGLAGATSQNRVAERLSASADIVGDVLQLKFQAADFNGWQTMYGFDAIRGVANSTRDTVGSRKDFLASAAAFRKQIGVVRANKLSAAQTAEINAIEAAFGQFMTVDATVIGDYRNGSPSAIKRANDLVAGREVQIFQQISDKTDDLVSAATKARLTDTADARSTATDSRTLIVWAVSRILDSSSGC